MLLVCTSPILAPPWSLPFGLLGAAADLGGVRVPVWLLVVACAVVSTALAYLLSISALRDLPATVVSALGLVETVVVQSASRVTRGSAAIPSSCSDCTHSRG